MNLLGSASYDPSVAVSKATSALLALTAIDTTNLRLAITVPAHGKVKFLLACTVVGATTLPGILLGVLNGATVLKRQAPQMFSGTQDRTTEMATAVAEFTVTGLTPGAMSVDAAYAVQVIVASTNIKFGGPNDTTGADAWGAFVFEAWDPQPIPTVAPGASGGLLIAGANAATTYATLTSTGAFSVNGVNAVSQTGDSFARIGAPAGASASADVAAVKADTAAVKLQTDKMAFTVANQIDSNVIDWKGSAAPAMTGDAFARIGAPAGASVSADIAAVKAAELTGAQMATAIWQDTVAGDFTAALSIGKSVLNGVSLGTGLTINSLAGNTAQTGDAFARIGAAGAGLTALGDSRVANLDATVSSRSTYAGGAVASVTAAVTVGTNNDKTGYALSPAGVQAIWDALTSALTTVGSIGKSLVTNIDAAISSRMATFTQPTGFLAATFPTTVASPTNITAGVITTVTNLTNAPTAGDFTTAMKTSLNAATPAVTVSDKTGFSLTQAFPTNFASLGIAVTGHLLVVDTLTTYTGNTPQTGDAFARVGAAGAGLTALGDTRIAHLDADVSSRLATAGYTAPDNTDVVSIKTTLGVAGAGLTALGDTRIAHLDADVSSRLATSGYTAPPSAATVAGATWDVVLSGHLTAGTTGSGLNAAGSAGDPWTTALPGAYGVGTAGNIVGNKLDATISSRLATTGYTAPDNADITSIKTTIGVAGAGLTALGDVRLAHLDADVSSRLPTSGYTAPDNADVASIKTTLGIAGAGLTALGDARVAHLDADVSTRLPTSGYTAPDNASILLVKAKTDNLPLDPADASDIAAAFSIISGAISGLNNISAAGVRAALGMVSANLDTQLAAQTPILIANEVATRTLKANVKEINDVLIHGDGTTTKWGP